MNTYIDQLTNFFTMQWLDIFTTILGLIYIYLEYKASIYLWLVGILMHACDVFLYWNHGLYGDAGMAVCRMEMGKQTKHFEPTKANH